MKKLLLFSLGFIFLTSCVDLDIPPKNIVSDEALMSNAAGLNIYMARMYSNMPIEDFKYMAQWGIEFNSWLGALGIEGTGEALNRDGICSAFTGERTSYWGKAFTLLRDANHLIATLPNYKSNFNEQTYNDYLGEGYFVRAFVFYAMARRFGGIPLVTREINYPGDAELEVARSSEEETWDQILSDFDMAASLMTETSIKTGYANKNVALAYKAEAMLYAGCVAKYNETLTNRMTGFGEKTGVRVMGFDPNTWEAASKKYFTEAYKAANAIINSGKYSLYKKKWSATDKTAQYQNMVDMFSDLSSPENILVREYEYPTLTHGLDAYSGPYTMRNPLSAGTCPTLDFVELFEGFPRYADGSIKVTDGASNTAGKYIEYANPLDFFANAEPRLRAYVIFPGDVFKNTTMDIRAGVYTGAAPASPLLNDYSYSAAGNGYDKANGYNSTLFISPNSGSNQTKVAYTGTVITPVDGKINAAGEEGPFSGNGEATLSGMYGRKYLNTNTSAPIGEGKSAQPFILMRYADVLLAAAEAAVELGLAGVASPDGSDMLQVATTSINSIRERAGATQLTSKLTATTDDLGVVRKERRKELALEHKTKWDLRRWRVWHYEGRDGFWGETKDKTKYSSDAQYRFRGLYPFFSTQSEKYFYDARFQWVSLKTFSFSPIDYYFAIPSGEVTKSAYIDQQPNR